MSFEYVVKIILNHAITNIKVIKVVKESFDDLFVHDTIFPLIPKCSIRIHVMRLRRQLLTVYLTLSIFLQHCATGVTLFLTKITNKRRDTFETMFFFVVIRMSVIVESHVLEIINIFT